MPHHKRRKSNGPDQTQSWRKIYSVRLIWRLDKIHFVVSSEKEGTYWRRVGKYFHEHRKLRPTILGVIGMTYLFKRDDHLSLQSVVDYVVHISM
jgi:hypothetical protein